jgi:hypothetical protein
MDVGMSQSIDNIQNLQAILVLKFPELQYAIMRHKGQIPATESIQILFQDLVGKVVKIRGRYDSGLVRAQQMALSIGGMRGVLEGFKLNSYEAGQEKHRIGDRPVLTQAVDLAALELAYETGMPARRIWEKLDLGFTDAELDDMEKEAGRVQLPDEDVKTMMEVAIDHIKAAQTLTGGSNE